MAIAKKKKKAPSKKKLDIHEPVTFHLTWTDTETGEPKKLWIGTMHWCSIGTADAKELEKLIGQTIIDYFNGQLKKIKGKKKNAR